MANPQCHAVSKRTGDPCTRPSMDGQKVCYHHGGNSRQAKAKAQLVLFEQRARNLLVQVDDRRPIDNPFEELLGLAAEVVAFKDAVAVCVGDLHERILGMNADGFYELRPEVTAYERALDRSERILSRIVQLGIEDRMVRIGERQAEALARMLDGVLTDLGHNPLDPSVAAVVTRRLAIAA